MVNKKNMKEAYEKEYQKTNKESEEEFQEEKILSALKKELRNMELRRPATRKEGKGDLKYKILYKFIQTMEEKKFQEAYNLLEDYEKHAIITRLENQAYAGEISFEIVELMRRELYGVYTNKEGEEFLNFEKQVELEEKIQNLDKENKN